MVFFKNASLYALLCAALCYGVACGTPRTTPTRPLPPKPGTTQPNKPPVTPTKPGDKPSGNNGTGQPGNTGNTPSNPAKNSTYRLAVVLPFATSQFTAGTGEIPEKSSIALQYYSGIQVGLAEISVSGNYPNLVVDIVDSQVSDSEFQQVMQSNSRLKQAQVIIGPLRNSHISAMANQIKTSKQILISPESPTSDLTEKNPGFIQTNPPLRAHCARIIQHLRSEKKRNADQIILICKEKEADRLPYFQEANAKYGTTALKEVIVPDASTNFDKIDFKKYIKPGQTTTFVMPSWAGQDWIVAFLGRLKQQKGSNKVEVFGMPQWADYEQIEPEMLTDLQVHITSARYIDRASGEVQAFEQGFYDKFGTLPDDDAYAGYDAVKLAAQMLQKYGLNFPEKMSAAPAFIPTLSGGYYMRRVQNTTGPMDSAAAVSYDYVENIYVHILKFEQFKFRPLEN